MLEMINKIVERQEYYEAAQREIENQLNHSQFLQQNTNLQNQVSPQNNIAQQNNKNETYSVYNRLYSNAVTKIDKAQDQGVKQSRRVPNGANTSNLNNSQLQINNQSQYTPNVNDLSVNQNNYPRSGQKMKPGHALYEEFHERQRRQKATEETQKHHQAMQSSKSKVNMKSHQLAYKKLERDIDAAIRYVDYEDTKLMNTTQIGQLFFVLGIFKYLFNEEYENMVNQQNQYYQLEQPLNNMQIKIEERKLREEEFLMQFWLKINPGSDEHVDSEIVLEFLKIIYDPYCFANGIEKQERLVTEYVRALKKVYTQPHSNNTISEESEDVMSSEDPTKNLNNEINELIWTDSDLLKAIRYLTDNFTAFKNQGNGGGIKVPTIKQRKGFYEAYKECTFKPQTNKKSQFLEKQHWINFFNHQNIKSNQLMQASQMKEDLNKSNMIGKIVSSNDLKNNSMMYNPNESTRAYDLDNPLDRQVLELQNNPSILRVDPQQRVELLLEKQKIQKEKLKKQQQIKEQQVMEQCTFKPNILKSQVSKNSVLNKAAHERLWELSKQKRLNMPQKKNFDEELEELQECTFHPNINKNTRSVLARKKSNEPAVVYYNNRGEEIHSNFQSHNEVSSVHSQGNQSSFIKGYDETVQRIKKAKEMKEQKKQQIENLGKSKNYTGVPTKVRPFDLATQQKEYNIQNPKTPQ